MMIDIKLRVCKQALRTKHRKNMFENYLKAEKDLKHKNSLKRRIA